MLALQSAAMIMMSLYSGDDESAIRPSATHHGPAAHSHRPHGLMKIVLYLHIVHYNLHQSWGPLQGEGLAPLRVESPNNTSPYSFK